MKTIKETVRAFFEEANWRFEEVRDDVFRSGVKGDDANFDLLFQCKEEQQQLIVIGYKASLVPEAFRPQAAELLTRANYILNLGSYGMDYSDGEFRFRIGIDVEDGELSTTMVRNITFITCRMLEQMYPCIMKLVYGNGNVLELYEEWKRK